MDRKEIRQTLVTQIRAVALSDPGHDELIKDETNLRADMHFDSLDRVDLAMALEDEFHFAINDEEFDPNGCTVQSLTDFIEKQLNSNQTA
jgi:acyl carrier protein